MDVNKFIASFDLLQFCSRFISGADSLKDHRAISRKRFLLAMSGISTLDVQALRLWSQSLNFCKAVKFIRTRDSIDLESLCNVNTLTLSNNKYAGHIRTFQNWVGSSLESATYIPPPHTELGDLLNLFIIEFNESKIRNDIEISNLIRLYSNFIKIHPFADGNGRCARVLWLSLQSSPNNIPPFIYRLICKDPGAHDIAVRNFNGSQDDFWENMNNWTRDVNNKAFIQLQERFTHINKIIPTFAMSDTSSEIISYLSNTPFLDENTCFNTLELPKKNILHDLIILESIGFIKKRGVRTENKFIYECSYFYEMQLELEDLIIN